MKKRYSRLKCCRCGKIIPLRTRYYKGSLGAKYHISCGSHLKRKLIQWSK